MTAGLLIALLAAVASMLGRQAVTRPTRLLPDAGVLGDFAVIAISSIGGLSTLFAVPTSRRRSEAGAGSPSSIGFFAVVALATALTWPAARLSVRGH